MINKKCPVFSISDENLDEKIEECERVGSGYALEITDVKAYIEYIKNKVLGETYD